ncbi:MAG: hypothetical protein WDM81_16285 [Rhizomicrobium sp.]
MMRESGSTQWASASLLTVRPLDGGEHRDGRGQHAVAVEQRQAEDRAEADQHLDAAAALLAVRQGGEREHAAFAIVVGAHDEDDVFERHDDDEGPQDQRQRAEDRGVAGQLAAGGEHGLAHSVERAGADVAEHHAQRAQGEQGIALERARLGSGRRVRRGHVYPGEGIVRRHGGRKAVGLAHGFGLGLIRRGDNAKLAFKVCDALAPLSGGTWRRPQIGGLRSRAGKIGLSGPGAKRGEAE